jgi:NADH-quinone oxidoreductase subunit E
MCSGRVDPLFIFRSFLHGMDGVFIGGCWPGECHYQTEGNYYVLTKKYIYKRLLEHIGLDPDRLRLEWVSASEGIRFAEVMNDFSQKLIKMGPIGKAEGLTGDELKSRLEVAASLVPYMKLVEKGKIQVRFNTEKEYDEYFNSDEFSKLFKEMIAEKMTIGQLIALLRRRDCSISEITRELKLGRPAVIKQLNVSVRQGLIRFDENRNRYCVGV